MSTQITEARTADSFSQAASSYDRWAHVQEFVATRLMKLLPVESPPRQILDVGCGTGLLSGMLAEHYPETQIEGLDLAEGMIEHCRERWKESPRMTFTQTDADQFLSLRKYDLVASSCSFQWFPNPLSVLQNLYNLTTDSATLCLAVILKGSLPELNASYQAACGRPLENLNWRDSSEYLQIVKQAGFQILCESEEIHCFTYRDPWEVMRSLKGIGATFRHRAEYQPLSITEIKKLTRHYQSHFPNNTSEVTASYNLLYLSAKVEK